jgi:hypothetical protein
MEKETDFYTATMARVYADQGHWDKAAEIYRYLLKQQPERSDYLEGLAQAEGKMVSSGKTPSEGLVPLFHQWFDLMLRYKNLQKLRKLKSWRA